MHLRENDLEQDYNTANTQTQTKTVKANRLLVGPTPLPSFSICSPRDCKYLTIWAVLLRQN